MRNFYSPKTYTIRICFEQSKTDVFESLCVSARQINDSRIGKELLEHFGVTISCFRIRGTETSKPKGIRILCVKKPKRKRASYSTGFMNIYSVSNKFLKAFAILNAHIFIAWLVYVYCMS